jgi:hypothetical protein
MAVSLWQLWLDRNKVDSKTLRQILILYVLTMT